MANLEVTAPFDGSVIGTVPQADAVAVEHALARALALFRDRDAWIPKPERIAILRRAARIIESRKDELALQAAREAASRWPTLRSSWPVPSTAARTVPKCCVQNAAKSSL